MLLNDCMEIIQIVHWTRYMHYAIYGLVCVGQSHLVGIVLNKCWLLLLLLLLHYFGHISPSIPLPCSFSQTSDWSEQISALVTMYLKSGELGVVGASLHLWWNKPTQDQAPINMSSKLIASQPWEGAMFIYRTWKMLRPMRNWRYVKY